MTIHPTAIVDPNTEIHEDVVIGPHVIIEDHVAIGHGTKIGANSYLSRYTTLGKNNEVHMGCVLGHLPQDLSFNPDTVSYLVIGDHNIIRELTTIHRSSKPDGKTVIGNHNFLMAQCHAAHDVQIGDHTVICNFVAIGGHAVIGNRAFLGGGTVIHQFGEIGRIAMLSGNGRFSMNVPPFVMAYERNLIGPLNLIGLRRAKISKEAIRELKHVHQAFFYSDKNKEETLKEIEAMNTTSSEVEEFIAFIRNSKRPLALHFKKKGNV